MSSFTNEDTLENVMEIIDESEEGEILELKETQSEVKMRKRATDNERKKKSPCVSTMLGKRKKKSQYWDHYHKTNDPEVVNCKYCAKPINCSSRNGTNGLKNHILRCKKFPANIDKKQKLIDFESKTVISEDGSTKIVSVPKLWQFDHEATRNALARMLIVDELPFRFVEREGFRHFCKVINPEFVIPSRSTATRDCYNLFIEERKELKTSFESFSSRVCLTTDTWTSSQNLSYMCLTAHFIDNDWKLQKKIINFCPIAGHFGELIGRAVEKCLLEWGLKKILTVTVDNASSNDLAIQYLRRRINHWECSVLNGDYLHMRCVAHILNLVVKDGLKDVNESIAKVRGAVKYVRSSPARLKKFKSCVDEEKIQSKSLVCLDVETRWNSTFLMLDSAVKFRKAFDNLHSKDVPCTRELRKYGGAPDENDWRKVSSFLPFLKIFYDATLKLSGSRYVTGNSYVNEIYGIGYLISTYCDHDDEGIRKMAQQMKVKHDKYWANINNVNILLFVALVLDPRHKLDYANWIVRNSYDMESANFLSSKILVTLHGLFDFYSSSLPQPKKKVQESGSNSSTPASSTQNQMGYVEVMDFQKLLTSRYKLETGCLETTKRKSELDKYLADECELSDPNFDILQWWKDRKNTYPVLSSMARDLLAIPVSTVASESAFSTGGRVLDSFRTSLTPRMVEALICAQDWLRTSHGPLIVEESLYELENLEGAMEELTLEQPIIVIDESIGVSEDTF